MRSTMFPLSKEFLRLGISGLITEMSGIIFGTAPAKAAATATVTEADATL